MSWLMQLIINAVLLGGLYAAIGVGMNMIFGIVKLTNLAHGDFLILAAFIGLAFTSALGISPFVALCFVIPIMFFIGFIIQKTLINRVVSGGAEAPLLVTFGLSIILQNLLQLIWTPDVQTLPVSFSLVSLPITEKVGIPLVYLVNFIVAIVVIVVLMLYLKKTYQGQAIRAASDSKEIANLMGINVKRTYGLAMGIALITAAIAGVLIGVTYNFYPTSGTQYLIISFGVVVIAGMGSIGGTMVAGIIFALAQLLGAHYFGTGLQMLMGYVIIVIMLVFRPQGLFIKK